MVLHSQSVHSLHALLHQIVVSHMGK